MAVLSEGEMLLKEQVELQKGISQTNDEFKTMLASSKQYQQMLRAINRQLVEHNTNYGRIKEKNEEIFDVIFNYSKLITDQKLSSEFNNIYKNINKISDEFKDLNSKLQTGDISLKEYQKSFDKLSQVQKSIERQKILLDMKKNSIKEEFDAESELLKKKERLVKKYGDKTKDDLVKDLNKEISLKNSHQTRLNNLQKTLSKTSYIKRDDRKRLQDEIDMEISFIENKENSINKIKKQVKKAPTRSELTKLQDSAVDKRGDLQIIETVNKALDKAKGLTQETAQEFVKSRKEIEAIDKKIGNIGRTMGVLQHFGLNQIFDFKAVEDAMQSAAREEYLLEQQRLNGYDVTIKKFGVARAGISAMGSELASKFGVVGAVGGGIWLGKQILDLIFQFDERWREVSKNQGLVRSDAVGLLNSYQLMSKENERISIYGMSIRETAASQKELMDATLQISNALGVNYTIANKNEGDLIANIKERMGLTDELRQSLLENSLIANEGFTEYFDKILGVNALNRANNKFYLNDKSLLNDISKTSSSIRLQFKNHSTDLAQIVINSKKYGVNLQQLDSIMGGLMDWEKQAELQTSFFAQTGQYIDTSRLQFFSMYNDLENFQKEFDKLTGNTEEFVRLNRIAQQTKAEMFGMDRDSFSQMLFEKDLMKKIENDEEAKKMFQNRQTELEMQKQIDKLKEMGLSHEKIGEILGSNTRLLMSQQKTSDEFGRAIEKIKDTFASFVQNEDIENLLQSLSNVITGTSEFLMEHGELFGIRTKESVEREYRASKFGVGGDSIKRSLNSKDAFGNIDKAIEEDAKKDLDFLIRQYAKDYKIKGEYLKDFSNQVQMGIEKTSDEYLNKIGLGEYMRRKTQSYVKTNPQTIKIDDGIISPNGKVVVQTPLGQINTNPKDYLIATPSPNELLQKNVQQVSQFMIDDTKIVTTLQMVTKAVEKSTQEIVKAVSANKDVYLNQRKVGEMFNINNQRV